MYNMACLLLYALRTGGTLAPTANTTKNNTALLATRSRPRGTNRLRNIRLVQEKQERCGDNARTALSLGRRHAVSPYTLFGADHTITCNADAGRGVHSWSSSSARRPIPPR